MLTALNRISSLRVGSKNGKRSPHKPALLLALAHLYEEDESIENKFKITDKLENLFKKYVNLLDPTIPNSMILIEYPFFHLQGDGIWNIKYKTGHEHIVEELKKEGKRCTKSRLLEHIEFGSFDSEIDIFLRNKHNRKIFMDTIVRKYSINDFQQVETLLESSGSNPFIVYLNTMQSVQGNNTGALAEFQAQSENFALIEEEHPLAERIYNELIQGRHVILTGHAGDGKSTIALEVYRKLANLPKNAKLALSPVMDVTGKNISIVKDLSENKDTAGLLTQILTSTRTFLLVSNTGALLKMFKESGENTLETEATLLREFNKENGKFIYKGREFSIYNLAKLDNLPLAKRVFQKMLSDDNWQYCQSCSCRDYCVILRNRNALTANNSRGVDRIFLIYQRLLAYGQRLTMRQLMEHLAWTLTGGQDRCDIEADAKTNIGKVHNKSFFHLFWGNNGQEDLKEATQMQAIRALRKATFGSHLSPELERTLWTLSKSLPPLQLSPLWEEYAGKLRKAGLRLDSSANAAKSRSTLRRILYFMADGPHFEKDIDQYLDSIYTRRWQVWQKEGQISPLEKKRLADKIFAVLYEQFSGHQCDEMQNSKVLYLTQHRNAVGLRQSVQLLTAQIRIDDEFDTLQWKKCPSIIGTENRFALSLPSCRDATLSLDLDIAFLDYVERRYQGELAGSLSAAYTQRLETFKTALASRNRQKEQITLVRTLADKNTSLYSCLFNNGKLVVRK